jgi:hypothetical protein
LHVRFLPSGVQHRTPMTVISKAPEGMDLFPEGDLFSSGGK